MGPEINKEFRNRMIKVVKELAAFNTEVSIIGCRPALCKKISPPFSTSEDLLSGNAMLYVMTHNFICEMLIGNMDMEIFVSRGSCR
jgi:hypothetical protein